MVFATSESVCLRQQDDEWPTPAPGAELGAGCYPMIFIAREAWEEMGEPQTVTIAVEPGDTLNV